MVLRSRYRVPEKVSSCSRSKVYGCFLQIVTGYHPMGLVIAEQIEGDGSLLCADVGTGVALMGTLEGLNQANHFPRVTLLLNQLSLLYLTLAKVDSVVLNVLVLVFTFPF